MKNFNIWLTGLSGSGKTTISIALQKYLKKYYGINPYIFDGDIIRQGLCKDLNFSSEGRKENLRRVAETVKLFLDANMSSISAFISPLESDRNMIKEIIGRNNIIEVFCDCSIEICIKRDVKGLYKKAKTGEIKNFTGISSKYEIPFDCDVVIPTYGIFPVETCVRIIVNHLFARGIL